MNAAAMASIAAVAAGEGGFCEARCLREKSALKRRASGADSEQRVSRRCDIVGSAFGFSVGGSMAVNGSVWFLSRGKNDF